mmetsp:Transcript_23061/g.27283  ORF Transcript_23061/g.27283 Transcript_23061/m.27283 type:complete len:340 (-) Transcript_23061:311-1330(-)
MAILSAQFRYLFLFVSLANVAYGSRLREQANESRQTKEIYMASSTFDWTVLTPNPRILSTSELFSFESNFANFFEVEIRSSTTFPDVQILALDFDVKDQFIDDDNLRYGISAYVTITYSGEFFDHYSDLLSAAVTMEDLNEMIVLQHEFFGKHEFFGSFSQSANHSFLSRNSPSLIGSTDEGVSRTMVIFVVLIGVSFILAITSTALFFQSGCCPCRSKATEDSSHDIKLTSTEETGDEESDTDGTTPDGKLGANKQRDGDDNSIVAITPQRGINHSFAMETPFTQQSEVSNASTTTSRDALGIVSMSTLNKLLRTPQAKQGRNSRAMYNVALNDDEND